MSVSHRSRFGGTQRPWFRFAGSTIVLALVVCGLGLIGPLPARAGSGDQLWASVYNGPSSYIDSANSVVVSPDGTLVFATGDAANPGSGEDYHTVAYDAGSGTPVWTQEYNGPGNGEDIATSIGVSPNGTRVFVAGHSTGVATNTDFATVAYDATTGNVLWAKRYDGPAGGADYTDALAVSPDGGLVFVAGSVAGPTSDDWATVAYDAATGRRVWARRYNGPGDGGDWIRAIAPSPDGSRLFVTGASIGTDGYQAYGTVAYSAATGGIVWAATYDGDYLGNDLPAAIAVSPDGARLFVTGYGRGELTLDDWETVAYDAATGSELWTARLDAAYFWDGANDVGVSPDGSKVYVTGQIMKGSGNDSRDFLTVSYDSATGQSLWKADYNGPFHGSDIAARLAVSPDGSRVFVSGMSKGLGHYNFYDLLTLAYDAATGGSPLWTARYDGTLHQMDQPNSMALNPDGSRLFVSGWTLDVGASDDFITVAYES